MRGEQMALGIDRMGRIIETEGVALGSHPFGQCPGDIPRKTDRLHRLLLASAAEQPVLPAGPLVVGRGGVGEDRLGAREHRRAVGVEAVERTGRGKAFELAAVQTFGVDPRGEIIERFERAIGIALGDQRLHRFLADALERA